MIILFSADLTDLTLIIFITFLCAKVAYVACFLSRGAVRDKAAPTAAAPGPLY